MAYVIAEPCITARRTRRLVWTPARWSASTRRRTRRASTPESEQLSSSIRWSASTAARAFQVCPVSAIYAADDLPEKWAAVLPIRMRRTSDASNHRILFMERAAYAGCAFYAFAERRSIQRQTRGDRVADVALPRVRHDRVSVHLARTGQGEGDRARGDEVAAGASAAHWSRKMTHVRAESTPKKPKRAGPGRAGLLPEILNSPLSRCHGPRAARGAAVHRRKVLEEAMPEHEPEGRHLPADAKLTVLNEVQVGRVWLPVTYFSASGSHG